MLMDMDPMPTQIYGMPRGVRGFRGVGNMNLMADDASQEQLNAIVDLRRKIMALVPTMTDQGDRDFVNNYMTNIFSNRSYPLSSDAAGSMLHDLGFLMNFSLNTNRSAKPVTPVGLPAGQTQPGFFDSIADAFAPVQSQSQQAQPGFIDSLTSGAQAALTAITSPISSAFSTAPAPSAPVAPAAPASKPDFGPWTVNVSKPAQSLPPAQIVDLPATTPPSQPPAKKDGSILDTFASIFGGLAIAAPGVLTAASSFRKPTRQQLQQQLLQQRMQQAQEAQAAQRGSEWGKVALVGGAVVAVAAISYFAFRPKKKT